ncbi:hypothetical protein KVR801_120078 [Klebsiella variicola]|nr:hypothetical protein KVR801_120078 [Klebsiella variicola]
MIYCGLDLSSITDVTSYADCCTTCCSNISNDCIYISGCQRKNGYFSAFCSKQLRSSPPYTATSTSNYGDLSDEFRHDFSSAIKA